MVPAWPKGEALPGGHSSSCYDRDSTSSSQLQSEEFFFFLGKPWQAMSFLLLACCSTNHHLYYLSADQLDHGWKDSLELCLYEERQYVHTWFPWNISKHPLCANLMFLLFFITANEDVVSIHTRMVSSALQPTRILPSIIFSPQP